MADPEITAATYLALKARLVALGYGPELEWQATVQSPTTPEGFAREAIFVICCSGMKGQVAETIYNRVLAALRTQQPVSSVFGHALKCRAIETVWRERNAWFARYRAAETPEAALAVLAEIDHIGSITKWHLAKNLGLDVCKPDRHLTRLAIRESCSPQALCARLATATGDRHSVVDLVLWRACNLGLLRSTARISR